ncbi:MAG: ABC transporter permease [Erysipelotrichaceae bacterium]|nr:ABC transporter permease [Erysipelotrichaceae bacterium]
MNKIINIILSSLKNSIVYKKKFITTVCGVSLTVVLLITGAIFANFSAKSSCVNDLMQPKNYALFYGNPDDFPISYFPVSSHQIKIDKVTLDNTIDENINITIYGVNNDFLSFPLCTITSDYNLVDSELLYGESFSQSDILEGNPYIMMQQTYSTYLFGNENPIGKILKIEGIKYVVKGIIRDTYDVRTNFDISEKKNIVIYVPKTVVEHQYDIYKYNNLFVFHYESSQEFRYIRSKSFYSYDDSMSNIEKQKMDALGKIVLPLSFIIVASFAIELIIIFINLRERYYEIGIKRAIGATKDEICFELLFENLVLVIISIILGVFIGILLSYAITITFYSTNFIFTFFLTYQNITIIISFSLLVSIIACLIPSIYASNSNIVNIIKGE